MSHKVIDLSEERSRRRLKYPERPETCEIFKGECFWWEPNDGESFIDPVPENAEQIIDLMIYAGKAEVGDVIRIGDLFYLINEIEPNGDFSYYCDIREETEGEEKKDP